MNDGDPRLLAAQSSTIWLNGWVPQLAPNILSESGQPKRGRRRHGDLHGGATGISDPTYQWQKNGTNINGQTNATLTINNANVNDAEIIR